MAASKERLSAKWSDATDQIFIEVCMTEITKGNRPGTSFSKEGWKNVVNNFNQKTGSQLDQKQLKNRWDQIKKDWALYKNLMYGSTGIGWDSVQNTIVATEEWWEERIKTNKAYKKFKGKDLSIVAFKYNELFRGIVATGEGAFAATQNPATERSGVAFSGMNSEGAIPLSDAYVDEGAEGSGDSDELLPDINASVKKNNLFPPSPFEQGTSSGSKRKRSNASSIKEGLQSLLNMTLSKSTETSAISAQPQGPTIESCMALLDTLPEIEKDTPMYYYSQTLFGKSGNRIIFMNQPNDRSRVGWLGFKYDDYLRGSK